MTSKHLISAQQICSVLQGVTSFSMIGEPHAISVDKIGRPETADATTLIWLNKKNSSNHLLIQQSCARMIICDQTTAPPTIENKILICCQNPKLAIMRIANVFFAKKQTEGIHSTAIIHPKAHIHPTVSIGAYTIIGACEIGQESVIESHCYITDHACIGKRVKIYSGCNIGEPGSNHILNEKGEYEDFQHFGKAIIEDDVELGIGCIVNRGTLADTIIARGCKIGNDVIIGHNVTLEEHVLVMPKVVIAGSVIVRRYAVIAMSANIIDQIEIGEKAHIGPGAIVIKSVAAGQKICARPSITIPTIGKKD